MNIWKGGNRHNMRNKYRRICCGIIMTIFCFSFNTSYAKETEKQYIVELSYDIALFDTGQSKNDFIVLSESELQEGIDAGIVKWYEEDFEVELLEVDESPGDSTPTSQSENLKWDLTMIKAQRAKEILCEGQDINVGVIDSGIINHPDIKNNIRSGYNYLDLTTDVTDNIGHGTFVSGMIAANENQMGVVGVTDEINIIPLKCFDSDKKTTVSIIYSAIKDAVDVYDCDIINMSLGLTSYSQKFEEAIKYATDNGVIVVAAVGNKGTDVLYYPAAFDKVIGVGSVNSNCEKSNFSQYNSSVDFIAPGENVWSTDNSGSYSTKSGTSFSTPLVTGLIASMMNIDTTLTHDEIVSYISQSATVQSDWLDDNGSYERNDNYGYGLINVTECLNLMLSQHTYFISPIDCETDFTQVAIVNNSDIEFEGYCMWGEYTYRGMMDMDWEFVKIPPGDSVVADTNITSNKIKCFLWKSINDISVISDYRERTAK